MTDPTTTTARYRCAEEAEAVQWTGSNAEQLRTFCGSDFDTIDPEDRGEDPDETAAVRSHTHGGWIGLTPGDWVVKHADHFSSASDEEFRARWAPAVSSAVPPTNEGELRDRIRHVLARSDGFDPNELEPRDYLIQADALLAVLPPPADRYRTAWLSARHRAGVLSAELTRRAPLLAEYAAATIEAQKQAENAERIRENADFHLGQEMARRQLAEKETARLRADRAAVLLWAADDLEAWQPEFSERWAVAERQRYEDGIDAAADRLRRLAAETPPLPSIHTNDVAGFCPTCGHGVLMLGDGGHVVCTLIDCPNPDAADELLHAAAETRTPEVPCCSDPTCTCNQVNAAGRCDCAKWDSPPTAETRTPEPQTEAPSGRRETVEYFLQAQQDDGTWEDASSFMNAIDWATERLAAKRAKYPDFSWRMAQRTSTVTVQPVPDCPVCRHWRCDGDGPCGALLDAWQRCTCTGTPAASTGVQTDEEACAPEIVAFRSRGGRLLRCLAHTPGAVAVADGEFDAVTAEELPDGGICTYPECGVDVLIPQEPPL